MDVLEKIFDDQTTEFILIDESANYWQPVGQVVVATAERDVSGRWFDQSKRLPSECSQEARLSRTERTEEDYVAEEERSLALKRRFLVGLDGNRACD